MFDFHIIIMISLSKQYLILFLFTDFTRLFEKLNTVQGSYESRLSMVADIIHEAGRFKRHSLVKLLTQFMESMMSAEKSINSLIRPPPFVRVNGHSR